MFTNFWQYMYLCSIFWMSNTVRYPCYIWWDFSCMNPTSPRQKKKCVFQPFLHPGLRLGDRWVPLFHPVGPNWVRIWFGNEFNHFSWRGVCSGSEMEWRVWGHLSCCFSVVFSGSATLMGIFWCNSFCLVALDTVAGSLIPNQIILLSCQFSYIPLANFCFTFGFWIHL